MSAHRGATARRASAFLPYAFIAASATNILPQHWLADAGVERKGLWLSALLLCGTLGASAGITLSRRRIERAGPPPLRLALAATPLFVLPLAGVVWGVGSVPLYLLLYVAFRAISNAVYNTLDHVLLAGLEPGRARVHATASTAFQILGQALGPVAFGLLAGQPAAGVAMVVVLFLGAGLVVLDAPPPRLEAHAEPAPNGPLRGPALRFLAYATVVQTGIIAFFAQLIFILGDYVGVASPTATGGLLIGLTGLSSIATVLLPRLGWRRAPGPATGPWADAWPPLVLALSVTGLALRPPTWGLAVCAVLAGIGGGQFLAATRERASTWEGPPGRGTVLSVFNNVPNHGALTAWGLLGLLALVPGEQDPRYYPAVLGLFVALFVVGAALARSSPPPRREE